MGGDELESNRGKNKGLHTVSPIMVDSPSTSPSSTLTRPIGSADEEGSSSTTTALVAPGQAPVPKRPTILSRVGDKDPSWLRGEGFFLVIFLILSCPFRLEARDMCFVCSRSTPSGGLSMGERLPSHRGRAHY